MEKTQNRRDKSVAQSFCQDIELNIIEMAKSVLIDVELQTYNFSYIALALFSIAIKIKQTEMERNQKTKNKLNKFKKWKEKILLPADSHADVTKTLLTSFRRVLCNIIVVLMDYDPESPAHFQNFGLYIFLRQKRIFMAHQNMLSTIYGSWRCKCLFNIDFFDKDLTFQDAFDSNQQMDSAFSDTLDYCSQSIIS